MAFKKYPQPPFKKYVKTESGKIIPSCYKDGSNRYYVPHSDNKNGCPLVRFGFDISYSVYFKDGSGSITFSERVVATADTKEELEDEQD